jgi:hypothetical protein
MQKLFLSHSPNATRHTLSARLVPEKRRDTKQDRWQVYGIIESHDHS